MLIQISDTVMVNPNKITAIEIVPGRRLIIYVEGKQFNATVPYEELMPKLLAVDDTKQFYAG